MFTNSNGVKYKKLYAPRALLDVYALGQLKKPSGPRPFKLVALDINIFKMPLILIHNSYLRYKCKKLSFIARTGLKHDRGTIVRLSHRFQHKFE
jgi:hypothetical protein